MKKGLYLLVGLLILGSACTQRLICPAYQSSFIYDKESLRKKFSYFKEDSTPKILTASKNKYLIAVPESYRKKMRNLQTVEMKPVYPVIPDSLKLDHEKDLLMAERDVIVDSAAAPVDSVYAITKTKEKYNVDQDIYMWYFRELLVLPDVRVALEQKKKGDEARKDERTKAKGLFGRKKSADSTAVTSPDPADSAAVKTPRESFFKNLFKKKNKSVAPKETTPKNAPAKKEEEDDGF